MAPTQLHAALADGARALGSGRAEVRRVLPAVDLLDWLATRPTGSRGWFCDRDGQAIAADGIGPDGATEPNPAGLGGEPPTELPVATTRFGPDDTASAAERGDRRAVTVAVGSIPHCVAVNGSRAYVTCER